MRKVPLVIFGFGHVGQSLVRLLEERSGFEEEGVRLELAAVFDRGGGVRVEGVPAAARLLAAKREGSGISIVGDAGRRLGSPEEVLGEAPGAMLVDVTPTDPDTGEPGLSAVRAALSRGHSVVLASKGPLIVAFRELAALAREKEARLGISAAVGTPLPSLDLCALGLRGAVIAGFRGLLNETANRILRSMEAGGSFEAALEEARRAGVMERDERLDIDGWDAAYKALILARALWNPDIPLRSVRVEGIAGVAPADLDRARARNRRIRLLATGRKLASGEVELRVGPELLEPEDPLYPLRPGEKGAVVESAWMGRLVIRSGKGGPMTTAATVVKDVLNIAAHPTPWAL